MKNLARIIKKIKAKLKEKSGETIVETLVSMLIVVLSFTMLAGAIVAAARVNAGTEKMTLYLNEADSDAGTVQDTGSHITIETGSGIITTGKTVRTYKMKDSAGILYYYE